MKRFLWALGKLLLALALLPAAGADELCPGPDKHLTAVAAAPDGAIWTAAENGAVRRFRDGAWEKFDASAPGFPDTADFSALAVDKQGRVWVGTVDKGVAVFNGQGWKTYGVLEGPLSARVFALAVSPAGTVAVAHAAGIDLYYPGPRRWRSLTALDGLPVSPVTGAAFADDDKLWLAFSHAGAGLVTGVAPGAGGKARFAPVVAPWVWDKASGARVPLAPAGAGLPSNLLNAIAVGEKGRVFAATVSGLGVSKSGEKWKFWRGADWKAKAADVLGRKPAAPGREPPTLPEDYLTALLPVGDGAWAGTRAAGAALIDAATGEVRKTVPVPHPVRGFAATPHGLLAATYGGGLARLDATATPAPVADGPADEDFPAAAAPPTAEEVAAIARAAGGAAKIAPGRPFARYVGDDWATRGDWCERYGRHLARLCAANAPGDLGYVSLSRTEPGGYGVDGWLGPRHKRGDDLRRWMHWPRRDGDRNVLFVPCTGIRIESEWDDHGEDYPRGHDGPDLWLMVDAPAGPQKVSLYFFSPNNREGVNGERDYLIEVYAGAAPARAGDKPQEPDYAKLLKKPPLARARAHCLGTGVHKLFVVNGPGRYWFRVLRNYSFNTIVNGIFVSAWNEKHKSYEQRARDYWTAYNGKPPVTPSIADCDLGAVPGAALQLNRLAENHEPDEFTCKAQAVLRVLGLRAAAADKDCDPEYLRLMRWRVPVLDAADHAAFAKAMRESWLNQQKLYHSARSADWYPHSPHVTPFTKEELLWMDSLQIPWEPYAEGSDAPKPMPVEEVREKVKAAIKARDEREAAAAAQKRDKKP